MAGTSARRNPAHRRFIGNGPGTENAAKSAQTAQACLRMERRRACARVLSANDTRSHAACADGFAACWLAVRIYVLTEASSGAPLPRLVPGKEKRMRRRTRVVKPGG